MADGAGAASRVMSSHRRSNRPSNVARATFGHTETGRAARGRRTAAAPRRRAGHAAVTEVLGSSTPISNGLAPRRRMSTYVHCESGAMPKRIAPYACYSLPVSRRTRIAPYACFLQASSGYPRYGLITGLRSVADPTLACKFIVE
jgi:hypothetical protein